MASKSNEPTVKNVLSCSDFLEWSADELKYYLAMRGLSREGSKLDLAARVLVAYEQKHPIRQDVQELEIELKQTYAKLLTDFKIPDPKQIDSKDWVDDVSKWPHIDLGKVFSYVLKKKAFESEYIGQYKAQNTL